MSIIKFKKNRPIIIEEYTRKRRDDVIQTFKSDNALVDGIMNNNFPIKPCNLPKQNLDASFKKLVETINNSKQTELQ